ncbi:MAG: hypothetical protein H6985_10200 [Pseudomonadales bacterium]|nr:hypothetical protein [Pseudomonadales bacterium]
MTTSKNHPINYYIALLFLVMMPAFGAELKPWNSQEALQLSDSLYSASRKLNAECRQSPPKYLDEGTSGHTEFRYHVRHFMSVTRDLSESLENGANQAETQPIYAESVEILSDLKKYAGGQNPKAWPQVVNAVSKAESILNQLGAFYATK